MNKTIKIKKQKNNSNNKKRSIKRKYSGGNKKLIIKSSKISGFFSNFNKLMTWLVSDPTITTIDFQMKSGSDGVALSFIKEDEELFSHLFEAYDEKKNITETLEKNSYESNSLFADAANNFYNENHIKLQPYHDAYIKFIKIKPNIQEKIDKQIGVLKKNSDQVIGIFIRSQALANEQPNGRMPTREEYDNAISKIDTVSKKTKYFLCIDNDDDLNYFKNKYKPNYYTNIRRTANSSNGEPHTKTIGTLKDLEDTFIEVVLLSQCDILLHCVSNMVTASLFMNMNQKSILINNVAQSGGKKHKNHITKYRKGGNNQPKIFVVHYTALTERKEHVIKELGKYNLDYEFITDFDKENINSDTLKKFDRTKLKISEISLLLKHKKCWEEIYKKYDYAVVFEDDIILSDNFNNDLNTYINELPSDWDMFFIGTCLNIHAEQKNINADPTKHVFKADINKGGTRCTHAYMITKKCAKKLLDIINTENYIIDYATDWFLNNIIKDNSLNVYWAEPAIVTQGTETKIFKTSLVNNNT